MSCIFSEEKNSACFAVNIKFNVSYQWFCLLCSCLTTSFCVILHCLSSVLKKKKSLKYNPLQSLSCWGLDQFPLLPDTIFFIWFTFPAVLSVSQSKVGSAFCALCLIGNRHTMLSAETSLNKQCGEKQTVKREINGNTWGGERLLFQWCDLTLWKWKNYKCHTRC